MIASEDIPKIFNDDMVILPRTALLLFGYYFVGVLAVVLTTLDLQVAAPQPSLSGLGL